MIDHSICDYNHKELENLPPLPKYDSVGLYPESKLLSSSQFLRYEKDPAQFYVEYVLGVKDKGSVKMQQGRIFSALYENRQLDFKSHLHLVEAPPRIADIFGEVIKKMPVLKGGHPEYPLIAEFNGWKFRATLDDFVESAFVIVENKTGETVWTQKRVNTDDQITCQSWCHWKKYGVPPKQIILNWVDLRKNSSRRLTTFKTTRSIKALKNFEERVKTVIANLEANNFSSQLYD